MPETENGTCGFVLSALQTFQTLNRAESRYLGLKLPLFYRFHKLLYK